MNYSSTINYLYSRLPVFHRVGSAAYKPGLENTIGLMSALGNPEKRFRSIHVAGTNGKGSVSNMLAAVLQSAGYRVGLYTSPHLVDFRERIRVNGEMIDQQYVIDFVEQNEQLFATIEPSFFEATMAMAFNYFADSEVDVAVIEVGLGGRLDSTNIIKPELSIITNISFDHVDFLGNTLEKIAFEKAGIIKSNTPVVIGEVIPETRPVFDAKSNLENAPIYYAEESIEVKFKEYRDQKMIVETSDNKLFTIDLCGLYQLKNVATTLTAIDQLSQLGFDISPTQLSQGIENVCKLTGLQGRWQVVGYQPMVVVDTGHNVSGIQFVVEQLKEQTYKQLRIILGVVNDKDVSGILKLLPKNAVYYFTQANIERALSAGKLQQLAESYGLNGKSYSSVSEAINNAFSASDPADFIFIGGSNFIVGEAIAYF